MIHLLIIIVIPLVFVPALALVALDLANDLSESVSKKKENDNALFH
jgi:hypothetical protein